MTLAPLKRLEVTGVIAMPGEVAASVTQLAKAADMLVASSEHWDEREGIRVHKARLVQRAEDWGGVPVVTGCVIAEASYTDPAILKAVDAGALQVDDVLENLGAVLARAVEYVKQDEAAAIEEAESARAAVAKDEADTTDAARWATLSGIGSQFVGVFDRLVDAIESKPPTVVNVAPAEVHNHVEPAPAPEVHHHHNITVEARKPMAMKASTNKKTGERTYTPIEAE